MESIILLSLLVVLILLGSPIGFTLILLPTVYVLITDAAPLTLIPFKMFDAIDSVPLTAIPFFMLTGELMTSATITDRLVELSRRMIGRMRGSLAQVNVLVSMFFAGMNGSVVADAATVGSLLIPAMKRAGYPAAFAAAITAVSGTIGGIIPPSIAMIILANAGWHLGGRVVCGGHHSRPAHRRESDVDQLAAGGSDMATSAARNRSVLARWARRPVLRRSP